MIVVVVVVVVCSSVMIIYDKILKNVNIIIYFLSLSLLSLVVSY